MGRAWLLLQREASAGGSKEGAGVRGRGISKPFCGCCWLTSALPLLCCWHKAAEAGIPSSPGQNGLAAYTHPSCFPELGPFPARWCPSWLAGCPGQLRTCRSCCQAWADTRREPSHPSRTDR